MTLSPSITLFGPGVGESLCINLGNGDWVIVDSCMNPETKRPAALEFLGDKGVDSAAVKLIVVTHWHDDHIRGISETLRACESARLVIPAAMNKPEYTKLTYAYGSMASSSDAMNTGVSEMAKVFSLLRPRLKLVKNGAPIPDPISFATDGQLLYRNGSIEITSLSPSGPALLAALDEFRSETDKGKRNGRVIPRPQSNMCAVALHISFGDVAALLGSDLETSPNHNIGWSAVIRSSVRPQQKASVVKIPHHGSETGHHDKFWSDLVEPEPTGILTTYSRQNLPRESDIARMKGHSGELYCTTLPKSIGLPKRDKVVESLIKRTVRKRSPVYSPKLGRITAKLRPGPEWELILNEQARKL